MGKYYFPTKQKRHNLIYKGRLTKYQRAKQNKEILIMMAFAIPFILTQAFFDIRNDIKIDASLASENGAGVSAIASNEVGDVANTQANTSPTKLPPYETLPYEERINPVEEEIRQIAKEHNFKQADLLVKIAFCESSFNPLAVNYNKDGSSDYGLFQYNSIHNFGELPLDVRWSTEKTIEWIREGKLHAWNASKKCWSK